MKLLKYFIVLLLTGFSANAQERKPGQVTVAELEEKTHPLEPSAGAAILYSKGLTKMVFSENSGFDLVTEVEMKIKIYNKDGYDWANKIIPYFTSDSDRESVTISNAATYNLVNGAVKKTKLKGEGEFTETVNKYWKQKKIMMPDVKEGSVIEYSYVVRSPFISVLPEWRFQESIPVNYSEYTTKIPEYFVYAPNFRGYYAPKTTKTSVRGFISTTTKERTGNRTVSTTFTNNKTDFREDVVTYVLESLPAMKSESYVNNIDNYTSSVEHELSMTKYPDSPVKTYSNNWEDIAKTIYQNENFGPELKRTGYFENDITALLAGTTTPAEKTAKIFSYVKNRMNWNSFTGFNCDAGVKRAYTDKVGNAAEINLMLTAMLRYAGLNANPVLVSTRSNKIALFPIRTAYNYVVTAVEVDGKFILLDATTKWSLPNILPVRAINWSGRLIRKDGTSVAIDLMPQNVSKEIVNMIVTLDNTGKVSGKARDQYFDYNAYMFRESYNGLSQESYLQKLENGYKGIEVSGYKLSNDKDLDKPVMEEYDFTHSGMVDVIGDKMYLTPLLFMSTSENPFTQENRQYPVDFIFPHQDKYTVGISIPDGFAVESLPQALNIAMEENMGTFKYNVISNGNQIQLAVSIDINTATVDAQHYTMLKNFYQKIIEKQNEKIVLKKS
jgi:hypothetical protein